MARASSHRPIRLSLRRWNDRAQHSPHVYRIVDNELIGGGRFALPGYNPAARHGVIMSRRNLLFGLLALIAAAFLFTLWRDPETFRRTFTPSELRPRPQTVARTPRPASRTVTSTSGTTLLRELPREALLITRRTNLVCPRAIGRWISRVRSGYAAALRSGLSFWWAFGAGECGVMRTAKKCDRSIGRSRSCSSSRPTTRKLPQPPSRGARRPSSIC